MFSGGTTVKLGIKRAVEYYGEGYRYVADIDLAKYFDTINHDILINMLREEVRDESLLSLIRKCLKSGVMIDGIYSPTVKGSTQGSVVPVAVEHLPDEIRQNAGSERSQVRKVRSSYVTGWLGYYAIADMSRAMKDMSEWVRRRIRMYIWKQWKRVRTRFNRNTRTFFYPIRR